MASYRNISMDFWTDSKVVDDFTPEDRYIYLYCMTNPHTNLCGCYEVSIKQIANETGYNNDTVERLLKRLDSAHNVIRYSAQTKELLILNWCRYNWSTSEKLNKPLLGEIRKVKNDRFREYLAARYNERSTVSGAGHRAAAPASALYGVRADGGAGAELLHCMDRNGDRPLRYTLQRGRRRRYCRRPRRGQRGRRTGGEQHLR